MDFKKILSSDIGLSTIFSLITKVIGLIGGFVLTLLITNYFGVKTLGIYTTIFTLLSVAMLFGKFGLDIMAIKIIAENNGLEEKQIKYKNLLFHVFIISTIITIIYFFCSDFLVVELLGTPDILYLTKISAGVIIPLCLFYLNIETIRSCDRITTYSFMYTSTIVVINVCAILLCIKLFHFDLNQNLIIYTLMISIIISCLISFFLVIKHLFKGDVLKLFHIKANIDYSLLRLSLPLLFSGAIHLLMNRMDILMLSRYADLESVGNYNIILKFSNLLPIGVMATNAMVGPKYSKLFFERKFKEMEKIAIQSTKLILLIALAVLVPLIFFKTYLISLFNVNYNYVIIPYFAAIVLSFIYSITGSVGLILQMTGKQNIQMYVSIIALIFNVILNIILIPLYGLIGAIFSTYFSLILLNITLAIIVKKEFGIRTIIKI